MVRFTPARLFRRRVNSPGSTTSSVSPPDITRAESRGRARTKTVVVSSQPPPQSSLSRGSHPAESDPEVPETEAQHLKVLRLSSHFEEEEEQDVQQQSVEVRSVDGALSFDDRVSCVGSWNEAESGSSAKAEGQPADSLTLDLGKIRARPLLVVQEPTPDAAAPVEDAPRRDLSSAESSNGGQPSLLGSDSSSPATSASSAEIEAGPSAVSDAVSSSTLLQDSWQSWTEGSAPKFDADAVVLRSPDHSHPSSSCLCDGSFKTSISTATAVVDQPSSSDTRIMPTRKIWVRRPGASATLVQIKQDDLVDDVRDMILQKYANSLGKTFDAPDMTLHVTSRPDNGGQRTERMLGPEEEMCRTIDAYFPGGQTVDDALIINVPQKRTPRPSPKVWHHHSYQAMDDYRPLENGTDYFPPMPAFLPTSIPQTASSHESRNGHNQHLTSIVQAADHPRAMTVLSTGQVPPLPSPGATARRHQHRPKAHRQPTSSPTILSHPKVGGVASIPPIITSQQHMGHRQSTRPRLDSSATEGLHPGGAPAAPPLPSPPAPEAPPTNKDRSNPPTPGGIIPSHVHRPSRPKKARKSTPENRTKSQQQKEQITSSPSPAHTMLDGSVPPINVLIVEDNIINLRILEGLMKRLKVRWQTAMNGQIAVDKWRLGGYHLVLMDIQMPVMSGLQATKEIRRLERVNSIGVFSSSPVTPQERPDNGGNGANDTSNSANGTNDALDDKLPKDGGFFKSPVIIVALTASSLQSDRHEALAAGCNDFLTKPVNFVWLERKVKEWGCMQALIDFDGWRKWKEYAAKEEAGKSDGQKAKEREKEEKERKRAEKLALLQERSAAKQKAEKEEKERKKRQSLSQTDGEVVGQLVGQQGSHDSERGISAEG